MRMSGLESTSAVRKAKNITVVDDTGTLASEILTMMSGHLCDQCVSTISPGDRYGHFLHAEILLTFSESLEGFCADLIFQRTLYCCTTGMLPFTTHRDQSFFERGSSEDSAGSATCNWWGAMLFVLPEH